MESSESKESDAARVGHHCRTRVGQAALRLPTKALLCSEDCFVCARSLACALPHYLSYCTRILQSESRAMPRLGSSLRAAFVAFLGNTNAPQWLSLSAGATRPLSSPPPNHQHLTHTHAPIRSHVCSLRAAVMQIWMPPARVQRRNSGLTTGITQRRSIWPVELTQQEHC